MRIFLLTILLTTYIAASAGPVIDRASFIRKDQLPTELKKYGDQLYIVIYRQKGYENSSSWLTKDTITNFKEMQKHATVLGYRILFPVYDNRCAFLSLLELDSKFGISLKAYYTPESINEGYDIVELYKSEKSEKHLLQTRLCTTANFDWVRSTSSFMNPELSVTNKEFGKETLPRLWILSIGIDNYKDKQFENCKTDAISFTEYFTKSFQAAKLIPPGKGDSLITSFTLLDSSATKENILNALKVISSNSSSKDFFVFNFAGFSLEPSDSLKETQFVPFGTEVSVSFQNKSFEGCIPLSQLKEYLEYIPARNQLFITESGPTKNFRQEFISTLISRNLDIENLLNKNRIIIVPDSIGFDFVSCDRNKGPLNYYITSLSGKNNIFDLFSSYKSTSSFVAYELYQKQLSCPAPGKKKDYFSIFFEREFMTLANSLSGQGMQMRSGRKTENTDTSKTGYGRKYALVIGTNTYQASSQWSYLPNAVLDARAVGAELETKYGFQVDTLYNPTMNRIYDKLWSYSKLLGSTDQFIIYFAGHGDFDSVFLDQGVIVCSDSKPVTEDRSLNTYIPYAKLETILNKLPSKHILLMLDVCFGGEFGKSVRYRNSNDQPLYTGLTLDELVSEKSRYRTRKSISSGKGPVSDGYPGGHSPFAYFFLEVLRGNGGTNGFFTASQVYARLQSVLKSTPIYISFGNNEAGSDFVFEYTPTKK